MNIQDYYCEVDQDQADEARELLIKAGEKVWDNEEAFIVIKYCFRLYRSRIDDSWYVGYGNRNLTITTYPEFREMLLTKIEGDGKN